LSQRFSLAARDRRWPRYRAAHSRKRFPLTSRLKSEAGLILLAPANAALRGLVTAKRRELRQKYAELEPTTLDHDLLWMVCQSIAKDHSLAASQQFDEYSNLYRLLSEPIKAAPAAE